MERNMEEEPEIEILAEEDPISYFEQFTYIFESYGWYLLILAAVLAVIYKKAQPFIEAYQKKSEQDAYSAKYHKDPDAAAARLAAQERYAMNLQEKYNRDAEEYKLKQDEKEAKKREEWLDRQTGNTRPKTGGETLGQAGGSKSFKPEYNPLMGSGSSGGYRPTKKKTCGGGGCG